MSHKLDRPIYYILLSNMNSLELPLAVLAVKKTTVKCGYT